MGFDWSEGKYQAPPSPCANGTLWCWHVMPWELEVGDRVLGTDLVVAGRYRYWESNIGSNAERAHFTYPTADGRTITYIADSPCVSVIRERGPDA